jgi:hypothetical protein
MHGVRRVLANPSERPASRNAAEAVCRHRASRPAGIEYNCHSDESVHRENSQLTPVML